MCLHVAIQLRHGNVTLHLTCTHKTLPCHTMGTYTHAASHPYEHAACGSSNPSVWQTPCRIRSHHTWTSYQSLLSLSPLSHLMMTLNMQLKTSLRRVLLATPRVGTREHLHFAQFPRLHWCCACGSVGAAWDAACRRRTCRSSAPDRRNRGFYGHRVFACERSNCCAN